jgi:hypothetical protein
MNHVQTKCGNHTGFAVTDSQPQVSRDPTWYRYLITPSSLRSVPPMPVVRSECECGKCTVTQRKPGAIAVWTCHCSHCRAASASKSTPAPEYGTNAADWWCNVSVTGPTKSKCTTFAPHGCPCPIWGARRVKCAECETLLVNYGHGAFTGYAMLQNATMARLAPDKMPPPTLDTFYGSGLKNGSATSITYHGDLASTAGLMYHILCLGTCTGVQRACCCVGWGTDKVSPEAPKDAPLNGDESLVAP